MVEKEVNTKSDKEIASNGEISKSTLEF